MEPGRHTIPGPRRVAPNTATGRPALTRRRLRRAALAWNLATWLASRRREKGESIDLEQALGGWQVRGRALRWSEWLRDRLRPGWLRLRSAPDDES